MNVGIIQARMGSNRLPGKMMLPLAGTHTLQHIVHRVKAAETIDTVVVATSDLSQDDILEQYASRSGAAVYRGSEDDVLGRMYEAATEYEPDVVVRIAGDRPLLPPACIDTVVRRVIQKDVDYASNVLTRTFPRGFEAEAFTYESLKGVEKRSNQPEQREHVTPYYRSKPPEFVCSNITSEDVYDSPTLQGRTDLRLTLDEAPDYELLRRVYDNVQFDEILPANRAIEYIDQNDISNINSDVEQKTLNK